MTSLPDPQISHNSAPVGNERLIQVLQAGFSDLMRNQQEQAKKQEERADNDRLLQALQTGFSDLVRNQQKQAKKQEEQTERLQQAVEALKPKPPATDKKTEFWNAYKTLADEYDKEINDRYGSDLNTDLVFAGLFSAVDSAFIIQIQPELQPNGTAIIVIAQSLLYLSLGMTLLAALLAVLAMQWLMYYSAVDERGSIAARGCRRQQKVDSLRKWDFDLVMQVVPLLLQLGLFLFSLALSFYLSTIHLVLEIIVISLTCFGFLSYVFFLVSAMLFPSSPFQTPSIVARFIRSTLWRKFKIFFRWIFTHPHHLIHPHDTGKPGTVFDCPFPEASPEVPAVAWVLETSSDPDMISLAAEMVLLLQWPSNMDLRPQLNKLHHSLLSCFNSGTVTVRILDGMALQAIRLGRAYCALQWSLQADEFPPSQTQLPRFDPYNKEPELNNLAHILNEKPDVIFTSDVTMQWALQVIPSLRYRDTPEKDENFKYFLDQFENTDPTPILNARSFTDYLFCVNSFLSGISIHDMAWVDKSTVQIQVLKSLFNTLLSADLLKTRTMATIARVIKITGQLASKGSDVWLNPLNPYQQWQCQIYSFCNSLSQLVQAKDKQWLDVMLAAVVLTGTDYHGHSHCIGTHPGHQYCKHSWIHDALDFVSRSTREFNRNSTIEVASLFSALLHCNAPPTERHLDLLLRVLPKPGDMSKNAAHLLLHNNVINWFQDIQLQRILQDHHVWASLMRIACNNPNLAEKTIKMGHTLGNIAVWQSHIREELCSWITVFFLRGEWSVATDYNWALSELWKISSGYRFRDDRERTLGLTFVALSKVWKDLDFDVSGALYKFVQMLRCTGYAVLVMGYWSPQEQENKRLTPEFIGSFSVPLHDTLIEASEIMKHTSSSETISLHKKESFKSIAKILEHMADKMPTSPDLGIRDAQVYEFMARKELDGKLNALETFIGDDI